MKKVTLSLTGLLVYLLLLIPQVRADDTLGLALRDAPRSMQGIRPLGMGDAFIAVDGTDENAIFYNPAAINDYEKKIHMQFLLPTVEFSYKAISFFKDDLTGLASDISDATTNANKITVLQNFTNKNAGRYEEVGVHAPIAILMHKYITAALFYENRSVLGLLNAASSTVDIDSVSQGGLQVGSSYSFWDNKLQVGAALKFMERYLISKELTQRDVVANNNFSDSFSLHRTGFGVGGDIGVQAKIPLKHSKVWDYLDPTFALTLQDIANTRFTGDVGETPESLTAGFAVHPNYWKLKSVFDFDVRDLDHRKDFITQIHAGYEVTWPEMTKILRSVSLRAGMSQGYACGGFGLDFKYFKLNAATYGREIGKVTRQKESRMFGVELAAGF